ncbi:MAG: ABC-F family ATP-binding cassette domain-containing protein [Erysipelotrichaceae bacterium]|nr:ABC-F family ATP-binding cassette domain-containing protein [Erysipelotrichaceae bacterium]
MLMSTNELTKFHNEKCILDKVSFSIEDTDKIALVGVNGTGKSTFLKILADKENYVGKIIKKNGLRLSYLAQDDDFDDHKTIFEVVKERCGDFEEFEMKAILSRLKVEELNKTIGTLSGGQRKRVALAIALLKPCDLLLLDEPTNHMDNDMIEWLEKYLMKYSKAMVMVTHDRYFLERIATKIIEIDRSKIYEYQANYSEFLSLKTMREEQSLANERKRHAFLRKELEWIRSNAQARSTKSKERIERFEKLSSIEDIQQVSNVDMIRLSSRLGKKIMNIENLGYWINDKWLFTNFTYTVKRNDRIGIVGDNGCGKSTLLNLLAKELEPSEGKVELGETVRIGYFKQGTDDLDDTMVVRDVIMEVSNDLKTLDGTMSAKMMLERFLFDARLQYSKVGLLSGGEKRRLYLLKVLMSAPNVLLLDEPTNDLDIQTLQILEDYLDSFNGIVITVSHDRYFLDRCCDTLFAFENGGIQQYIGGYSDYFEQKQKDVVVKEKVSYSEYKKQQRENKPYLSSKDKKELESMESVIMDLEQQIADIDVKMNIISDFNEISILSNQRSELEVLLEQKNERWMELLEIEEAIKNSR